MARAPSACRRSHSLQTSSRAAPAARSASVTFSSTMLPPAASRRKPMSRSASKPPARSMTRARSRGLRTRSERYCASAGWSMILFRMPPSASTRSQRSAIGLSASSRATYSSVHMARVRARAAGPPRRAGHASTAVARPAWARSVGKTEMARKGEREKSRAPVLVSAPRRNGTRQSTKHKTQRQPPKPPRRPSRAHPNNPHPTCILECAAPCCRWGRASRVESPAVPVAPIGSFEDSPAAAAAL